MSAWSVLNTYPGIFSTWILLVFSQFLTATTIRIYRDIAELYRGETNPCWGARRSDSGGGRRKINKTVRPRPSIDQEELVYEDCCVDDEPSPSTTKLGLGWPVRHIPSILRSPSHQPGGLVRKLFSSAAPLAHITGGRLWQEWAFRGRGVCSTTTQRLPFHGADVVDDVDSMFFRCECPEEILRRIGIFRTNFAGLTRYLPANWTSVCPRDGLGAFGGRESDPPKLLCVDTLEKAHLAPRRRSGADTGRVRQNVPISAQSTRRFLIVSLGSGDDFGFEAQLLSRFSDAEISIHIFDCTVSPRLTTSSFFPGGLVWSEVREQELRASGNQQSGSSSSTISSIRWQFSSSTAMQKHTACIVGQSHRFLQQIMPGKVVLTWSEALALVRDMEDCGESWVDCNLHLLKVDVEGWEWAFFSEILGSGGRPDVFGEQQGRGVPRESEDFAKTRRNWPLPEQILLELHTFAPIAMLTRDESIGAPFLKGVETIPPTGEDFFYHIEDGFRGNASAAVHHFVRTLWDVGYVLLSRLPNPFNPGVAELSFKLRDTTRG